MDPLSPLEQRIAAVAALDQPVRRQLYDRLVARDGWTSRDAAAAELGLARSVVAFHLDKLVEAGALEVSYERTSGRSGPGAGRPSKLYRPAGEEIAASVPDRHYDLAGSLLAEAVATATRTGAPVDECLHHAARAAGREAAATAGARGVTDVLDRHGYEPERHDGEIALVNCPFHRLAEEQRELVCGMNLDFLSGLAAGLDQATAVRPRLDPQPGYCCVRLAVD